jgi:hypothetical protein
MNVPMSVCFFSTIFSRPMRWPSQCTAEDGLHELGDLLWNGAEKVDLNALRCVDEKFLPHLR